MIILVMLMLIISLASLCILFHRLFNYFNDMMKPTETRDNRSIVVGAYDKIYQNYLANTNQKQINISDNLSQDSNERNQPTYHRTQFNTIVAMYNEYYEKSGWKTLWYDGKDIKSRNINRSDPYVAMIGLPTSSTVSSTESNTASAPTHESFDQAILVFSGYSAAFSDIRVWNKFRDKGYTIIGIDLPNYGKSYFKSVDNGNCPKWNDFESFDDNRVLVDFIVEDLIEKEYINRNTVLNLFAQSTGALTALTVANSWENDDIHNLGKLVLDSPFLTVAMEKRLLAFMEYIVMPVLRRVLPNFPMSKNPVDDNGRIHHAMYQKCYAKNFEDALDVHCPLIYSRPPEKHLTARWLGKVVSGQKKIRQFKMKSQVLLLLPDIYQDHEDPVERQFSHIENNQKIDNSGDLFIDKDTVLDPERNLYWIKRIFASNNIKTIRGDYSHHVLADTDENNELLIEQMHNFMNKNQMDNYRND